MYLCCNDAYASILRLSFLLQVRSTGVICCNKGYLLVLIEIFCGFIVSPYWHIDVPAWKLRMETAIIFSRILLLRVCFWRVNLKNVPENWIMLCVYGGLSSFPIHQIWTIVLAFLLYSHLRGIRFSVISRILYIFLLIMYYKYVTVVEYLTVFVEFM